MMRSHIVNFSSFLILIVNLICLLSTLHTQDVLDTIVPDNVSGRWSSPDKLQFLQPLQLTVVK
jgi:hypothetical protein